jgi:hypothetical protein
MAEDPDRPSKIARHILRYGLTTLPALRALVLPELTEKAASRLAERLVASSWLARRGLPGGGKYFVLGERAAREHDTMPGLPFGYQALVGRIGVLHFCAKLRTDVFSPAEFREKFPELTGPGFSTSNYYVDPGDVPRLGYIHVDHGQAAERLVTKMRTRIAKRYRHLDFAELIQRGRFLIAIATPTEEKSKAVREELEGRDPIKVEFRVEAVPELFPLLVDLPPRTRRKGDA